MGDYLDMLAEDGVKLGEAEEEAFIEETGERMVSRFLCRQVQGRWLYCTIHFESLTDPVPKGLQRRIANRLRLPPEKYIF